MVKIGPFSPPQIAEEMWKYPTSLLLRRWADLNQAKALFLKFAETLGTDTGTGTWTVTHGNKAADQPLYSELTSGAGIGQIARTYGNHNFSRMDQIPVGVAVSRVRMVIQARMLNLANMSFMVGFSDSAVLDPSVAYARIAFDTTVGATFLSRTYDTAKEEKDMGVSADTSWHLFQIDLEPAAVKFYIDGSLKTTHTTQVPAQGLPGEVSGVGVLLWTYEPVAKTARYSRVAVWLE